MSTGVFLTEWAFRSAALILAGAILLRVLRVKDPAVRLAASIAMLCGSLALPVVTAEVSAIRVAMPALPAKQGGALWVVNQTERALVNVRPSPIAGPKSVPRRYAWQRVAVAIYFAVGGLLLLRLCAGLAMSAWLRRRSRPTGLRSEGVEVLESEEVPGPVTVGIVRPVIVLPSDWRGWSAVKLSAVLAHERSHILRRDPIVQVISRVHRALLWHNPLSWLLHRRIVRAAEEASDDVAVMAVRDCASYAEMLLEFMQRGARAPRWQGVAMARYGNAEARIHRILEIGTAPRGLTRWSSVATVAMTLPLVFLAGAARLERVALETPPAGTVAVPVAVAPVPSGAVKAPPRGSAGNVRGRLAFALASVKRAAADERPGPIRVLQGGQRYSAQDATLKLMISLMYKVPARQITGGPEWLATDGYDIEAQADRAQSLDDLHTMFQNLLADRFQLRFHRETKRGPIYALRVDPEGPRMKVNAGPEDFNYPTARGKDGSIIGARVSMGYFSWWLGEYLLREDRPVIDRTGLKENYDFTLLFAPRLPAGFPTDRIPPEVLARPSLFDALRDQLGLELRAEDGPIEYFVIDRVERAGGEL